jgi:histidinol-phosphatase (PHP family)
VPAGAAGHAEPSVLDYHCHLWPHTERDPALSLDQLVAYCEEAAAAGVVEVAVTEHLFRFRQAEVAVGRFWEGDPDPALGASMAAYWDHHARSDLDAYVATVLEAKAAGLPVVLGLEVDYYRGSMDEVGTLVAQYPFDVLLGSVHWIGTWRFDDLDDAVSLAQWSAREVDQCWDAYTEALEELAASGTCDVLAHPDLIKVAGHRPGQPQEWWERIAEAAAKSGMAAELSSAGWRKPVGEQYPATALLAMLARRGVPLTTASDAHHAGHVAHRAGELRRLLADMGVAELQAYAHRVPRTVAIEE